MIARTIGRRYSKALMAVATERALPPEALLAELEQVERTLAGEPRFLELLTNPKVLLTDRLASLKRLLDAIGPQPVVRNFFEILLRKGRLAALPEIVDEFRSLADSQAGVLRAAVTSAAPLTPAETDQVRGILEKRFSKTVIATITVDPELIGGLVIKIGSLSFDGSIRSQLKTIQSQLLEEVAFS
jgi:F-type H+-transporting ATPase subunit delta